MAHCCIPRSHNRSDFPDIDVIFLGQRLGQVIYIGDHGFMHRFKRTADTGKNHPSNHILSITRLQIVTAFDTYDFSRLKIHQLNNYCRGTDIDGQTVIFISSIAAFYL